MSPRIVQYVGVLGGCAPLTVGAQSPQGEFWRDGRLSSQRFDAEFGLARCLCQTPASIQQGCGSLASLPQVRAFGMAILLFAWQARQHGA